MLYSLQIVGTPIRLSDLFDNRDLYRHRLSFIVLLIVIIVRNVNTGRTEVIICSLESLEIELSWFAVLGRSEASMESHFYKNNNG